MVSAQARTYLYGEVGEGRKATRMLRDKDYKLIYYPCGNVSQLFDMKNDRDELHDCADLPEYREVRQILEKELAARMYGGDCSWIREGKLVGTPYEKAGGKIDFGLYNQRGYHWPAPQGYSNIGKNA